MSAKPTHKSKQILGYQLTEKIGSGGYGEVWSAVAPGGLSKAVKLVYGYHDENRAQTELKAMDRIKQVRHPFLLSLERIEVFEGQLVVVSELADMSLADLFDEYANKGEAGIPRDELLGYMRDAAEGLDFLSEAHSLQHLDIKPENLLLVSGHVKVADFGLVKDLQMTNQSLMTGMTPAYAAPELFDGSPTTASDQYSLAIVYQEMLSAIRPFEGTTPAQLAAQHMHGRPNLRPLPKSDQPIIAKALSKDPNVRFPNCRAMVEELLNRKFNKKKTLRRVSINRGDQSNTVELNDAQRDVTAVLSQSALPFQAVELKTLEPPECDVETAEFQPTLILAVGNTASRAAQKMKQRLVVRNGGTEPNPAVKIICYDSDRTDLTNLSMFGGSDALSSEEAVDLPLSKPEVYRDRASSKLGWLSRRWIYNIPRTLQTEGLRPLGRLAFSDHFEKICDSIQKGIEKISREENIAATCENLGINPAKKIKPRVVIMTSISGGIGSGMTLDLAYVVKSLLAERGLPFDCVTGLLFHSTNQQSHESGISIANAFAFLTELRQFNDYGYPGDPSLGLPEFQDEPPFDHVYFTDLGQDQSPAAFDTELDKIAEYVYLNTLSKCSVFFDACRNESEDIEHFALRTFGLSLCGPGNEAIKNLGSYISRELLNRWDNGDYEAQEQQIEEVKVWFEELELHFDGVSNSLADQFHEMLGDKKFNKIAKHVSGYAEGAQPDSAEALQQFLDGELGCPSTRKNSSHRDPEICHDFDRMVSEEAHVVAEQFSAKITELMNCRKLDIALQFRYLAACEKNLLEIKQRFDEQFVCCTDQLKKLITLFNDLCKNGKQTPENQEMMQQCVNSYFQFRIQELILRYSKEYCRAVSSGFASTREILKKYSGQIGLVKNTFDAECLMTKKTDELDIQKLMFNNVLEGIDDLTMQVELLVYHSFIEQRDGYEVVLNEAVSWKNQLPQAVFEASQSILSDTFKKVSIDKVLSDNGIELEPFVRWLNKQFNMARPRVSQCGGGSRMMIGLPQFATSDVISPVVNEKFSIQPAMLNGTCGDIVFCFEGEDVSLANVAYRLMEQRPDAMQLAKRLRSRDDVEWMGLDDLL